ncbi:MAG: YceI family protein [Niabella sp.]
MRNLLFLLLIITVVFVSCKSAPKADDAATGEEQTAATTSGEAYKIDSTQTVNFIGTKPVGQHNGSFNIANGEIFVNNGADVTGGKLTLDMASLKINDADTSGSYKLAGHLASPDFFEVATFPTAVFEITNVQPYSADSTQKLLLEGATHTLSGNLTLKGSTKNVSFPAIITVSGNTVTAQANFNINRTDWGLVYGNDQSLGDKFIRPEVNISFNITATK